jgi:hypothetical protein
MEFGNRTNEKIFYFFVGSCGGAVRYSDWTRRWAVGHTEGRESFASVRALFRSGLARDTATGNSSGKTTVRWRACRSIRQ